MSTSTLTLEQKIAAALTAADVSSTDLSQLIAEADSAIAAADKTAEEERTKALDPALSPDPKAAREAMQEAEFSRDRLKTLLPRLQARHKQLQAKEYEARWYAELEEIEAKRDALVEELRVYPTMVAKLVDILSRIPAIDAEVMRINISAPPGVKGRLRGVEQQARGVQGFAVSGAWDPRGLLALAADLKLPKFEADGNRYQYSWPLPQPNLALQHLEAMPPDPLVGIEAAAGTYIDARNRRIVEDNRRQIAEAERSQREFEKQKDRRDQGREGA
jgi:predicted transcriptional regulator